MLEHPATNRSLVFDQGVGTYNGDWTLGAEQKGQFLSGFASRFEGDLGKLWERRAKALEAVGARRFELVTQSRLVVGLGLPQPVETGFLLDRLTGCPYLPGSSVKGVLRHAAREAAAGDLPVDGQPAAADYWRDNLRRLFGPAIEANVTPARGQLTCFDAFPVRWPSLDVDVLTPHQSAYYTREAGHFPADWNDPTPVPFLTVAPGTRFAFHVSLTAGASDEEWQQLEALLRAALDWLGIGGKTAASYGFFVAPEPPPPKKEPITVSWELRVKAIDRANAGEATVPPLLGELSGEERRLAANALIKKLERKWLKQRKDKEWVQNLYEAAGELLP